MTETLGLGDLDWFAGLTPRDLAPIEAALRRRQFDQGQLILERGDPGDTVLFVLSGRVLAVHWTQAGREIVYSDIGPGCACGELSVLSGSPRSLSLYARSACTLFEMPGALLLELIGTHPSVRQAIMGHLVRQIHGLTDRVHALISLSVEERLRAYLLRIALERGGLERGRVLRDLPTHAEIANIVGANREAISRNLAKLGREGVIESGRRFLRILRPEALFPQAAETAAPPAFSPPEARPE
ncbi:Crp/Fnr family transcriptional regulator [Paracoccus sp. PS-1]|uniref:Crp/Fnr family transcriptional regulator n=1 Tax=unclassified Paracoccus (in: a-proteobacteria) TaxID=2688777 RepID=UPI0004AF0D83|nr:MULTISPECIES: Crp/Fnr family transcriptional regulator [unclassified Paracoccus (in: a-proteobacteria)]MDQ7264064.1 Crp/Fnr family transcriptional regulator [Paracoccus sp. PS1]RQP07067.1 MAG: Crp/Fnr family transcriptional regulator [Paracoccus sp. BP8]